jgi:hypothetical protein
MIPFMFFGAHSWRGESGRRYMFRCALTKNGIPEDSGGIYIFVRRYFGFFLRPLYVGKAANLRSRLLGHEKWGKAWWILGATERHVLRVRTEEERRVIEEDLIRGLKPPMNDVMMPRCEDDEPTLLENRRKWEQKRAWNAWWLGLFGMKPQDHHDHHAGDHEKGFYDPSKHKPHEFYKRA